MTAEKEKLTEKNEKYAEEITQLNEKYTGEIT